MINETLKQVLKNICSAQTSIIPTIISGQDGEKPDFPFCEINIINSSMRDDHNPKVWDKKINTYDIYQKNILRITLSITVHSGDSWDQSIIDLMSYWKMGADQLAKDNNFVINDVMPMRDIQDLVNVEIKSQKSFDVIISFKTYEKGSEVFIETIEVNNKEV